MMSRRKVLFRFNETRSILEGEHLVLNEYHQANTSTKARLDAIRNLLPMVQENNGILSVRCNFTQLSQKLGMSKGQIYKQLIAFYHQQKTDKITRPSIESQKMPAIRPSEVLDKKISPDQPLDKGDAFETTSAVKGLQHLRLDGEELSTVQKGGNESYSGYDHNSEYQPLTSDDSSGDSNSEVDGLFNMTSASTLLHRSLILGHKNAKKETVESKQDEKGVSSNVFSAEDDELLSSGSLRDSLLADELLKHI